MKHPRIAVTFAANCVVAGCGWSDDVDEPCRDDVSEGSRYVISVGAHQFTTPVFDCPSDFDLTPGVELQVTVTELLSGGPGCASGLVEVADFNGWSWNLDRTNGWLRGGGADLEGGYLARNGECSGRVVFRVLVGGDTLERAWIADDEATSCPSNCSDKFDCEVTKIR